jgi:zinc transport system ATP-binding protein
LSEALKPAVEVVDLSVRFGDRLALDQVSFAIPHGSFLAVVGPNGSGKSTLLKTMLGLIRPETGRISIETGEIGYVPQLKTLDRSFPATAVDVVCSGVRKAWPFRISQEERLLVLGALTQVDAAHLADEQIGKLSGGELQRVYLARALARKPRYVFLDEPATGIDVAGEQGVYNVVERVRQHAGATVVMVTHDLSVAVHHATHALLLSTRQVAFGTPEEALGDDALRLVFGHAGHKHGMRGGA